MKRTNILRFLFPCEKIGKIWKLNKMWRHILTGVLLLLSLAIGIVIGNDLNTVTTREYPIEIYNKPLFLQIAEDISQQNGYINDSYDCVNFTKDLRTALEIKGYTTLQIIGYVNENSTTTHSWVGVVIEIEPITGKILNPNEYMMEQDKTKRKI